MKVYRQVRSIEGPGSAGEKRSGPVPVEDDPAEIEDVEHLHGASVEQLVGLVAAGGGGKPLPALKPHVLQGLGHGLRGASVPRADGGVNHQHDRLVGLLVLGDAIAAGRLGTGKRALVGNRGVAGRTRVEAGACVSFSVMEYSI